MLISFKMKHLLVLLLQILFWGQILTAGGGKKQMNLSKFIDMIEQDEQKVHDGIKSGHYEKEDNKAAKTYENDDDDYGKLLFDDMANFRKVKIPGVDYNMEPEAIPVAYSSDASEDDDDDDDEPHHDLPQDHHHPHPEENFHKENEELNERPRGPPAPYNYPESPPEQSGYPQQPPPDHPPPENHPPDQYQGPPPPDQQTPHFDNQRLSPEHQPPPEDYAREQEQPPPQEPPYERQLHRHEHERQSQQQEQQPQDQYAYQDSPPDSPANPYDYPPPPENEPPINHQSIPPEAYAQLPPIEEKTNSLNSHDHQTPMQGTYQEAMPHNNYPEIAAIGLIQNDQQPIDSPINSYRETMQYNENLDPNQKAMAEQLQFNPLLAVAAGPPYEVLANSQIGSTYNGQENQKLPQGSQQEVYDIDNNDQIGQKVFSDSPNDPQLQLAVSNEDASLTNSLSAQPQYFVDAQQIAYANQNMVPQPIPVEVETMQYDSQTPASKTVKNVYPETSSQVSSEHKPRHVRMPDENKQITKRVGLQSQPQDGDYDHNSYPKSYKSPNRYNKPTIGSREYSKTQKYTSYTPMEESEPEKRDPMQQEQQSYYDRWAEEQKKYAENDKYKSLEDDVEQEMPPNYKTGSMNPTEQQYYDEQQHQNPHNHPQDPHNHPQDMHNHPPDQHNHPQDPHNYPPDPHNHPQDPHNHPQDPHNHPQDMHNHPPDHHNHPQEPYSPPQDPHNHPQEDHPHYDDEPPHEHHHESNYNHNEPPHHHHNDQRDRQSDPDRQQYRPNQDSNEDHSHHDHDQHHHHIDEPNYNPEPPQSKTGPQTPSDYKEPNKHEPEVYDKSYESNGRDYNEGNKNNQKKHHSQPFQYNQQQEHPMPKQAHKPRPEPNRNYHKLLPQQQGLAYQEPNSYDPFQEEYIKQQNSDPFNEKYRNDQQPELFKEHYKKHHHQQQQPDTDQQQYQQNEPHLGKHQTEPIQQQTDSPPTDSYQYQQQTDSPTPDPYQYQQQQQKTDDFQEQPQIDPYQHQDQHEQQQQTDDYQQQPQLDPYQQKKQKKQTKPYHQANYYEQQTDHYTPKQREDTYQQHHQQNPAVANKKHQKNDQKHQKNDHYRDEPQTTEPYEQQYQTDNYEPQQQSNPYEHQHQTDHYHQPKHQPIDPYQKKPNQNPTQSKGQYEFPPYNQMPLNDDNSYNKEDKLDNSREGYDMGVENKEAANGQFGTFSKLPFNFETLIQADTSFLDALTPNITGLVEPPLSHDDYSNNNEEVTSHHTPYYYENTPEKGNDDPSAPLSQPVSQTDKFYNKPIKSQSQPPKQPKKERFQHYTQSHINHDHSVRDPNHKQTDHYPRQKNVVTRPTLTTESYDEQHEQHDQHNHHHDHQQQQQQPLDEPHTTAYDERQLHRGDNRYRSNKNSYNHNPNINHNHNQQQQHNYRHYPQHSSEGSQEHYFDDQVTAAADGSRVNNMPNNVPHFIGDESKKVSIQSNMTNNGNSNAPVIIPQLINPNSYNIVSEDDNFAHNNTENFFHKRLGLMPASGRQMIDNVTTTTAKNNFFNRIEHLRNLNRKRFLLSKKYNNRAINLNNHDTKKQL